GRGLVESLTDRHLLVRLSRADGSEVRTARWAWSDAPAGERRADPGRCGPAQVAAGRAAGPRYDEPMLVLALDTATPAVLSGVVRLDSGGEVTTLAERATVRPRAHNELLVPQISECLAEADIARSELAAVVVGAGP